MQISILIVEDELQVRKLLHVVLSNEGFDVIEAEDGTRALSLIRKHHGRIRAVLTDIDMGRMNGIELAKSIKAEFPAMPIAFISALPVPPAELERAAPQSSFLSKPFDAGDLLKTVRHLIERSRTQ